MRDTFLGCVLLLALFALPSPTAVHAQPEACYALLRGEPCLRWSDLQGPRGAMHPRYQVNATLEHDRVTGTATIVYTHTERAPTAEVALRLFANAGPVGLPARERITVTDVQCVGGPCTYRSPHPSVIFVTPVTPLQSGQSITITLSFSGQLRVLPNDSAGTQSMMQDAMRVMRNEDGDGDYGLFSRGNDITMLAGFFPVVAKWRSGWVTEERSTRGDIVTDRLGHFDIRLTAPQSWKVAATGVELSRAISDAQTETRILAPFARDFAVVASPRFAVREATIAGVKLRVLTTPEHALPGAQLLDAASAAFTLFDSRFGAYPWTELDLAEAVVLGAGGVEFSGLATVSASYLGSPLSSSSDETQSSDETHSLLQDLIGSLGTQASSLGGADMFASARESIVVHEVAHQWWHGLVGSDSREHAFIDESLAQYSTMLYFQERYASSTQQRAGRQQVLQSYQMMRMTQQADARVDRATDDFNSELQYAGLVYGKAPFFFEKLRALLGDRDFFQALRSYADAHRFGMATPADLASACARGRHASAVRNLYARWFEQAHGDADLGLNSAQNGASGAPQLMQLLRSLGIGGTNTSLP